MSFTVHAQISGTVFRDYNSDGIFQPLIPNFEIGIEGIIINAYDPSNTLVATTLSAANGTYSLPLSSTLRIEFEMPASTMCFDSACDFSSISVAGNNVRFVNGATANLDYGIQNPDDYIVTSDPLVFISRFNRGDPLNAGTSAAATAFYSYPYSTTTGTPTFTATADQIGSVWGVAYSKQAKKVFSAAFLKRQSGLGPLGSGGIYLMEPAGSGFIVSQFYDMDAHGHRTRAAASAVPYGVGSSFSLNASGTQATYLGPVDPLSGLPEGLGVIGVNGAGGRGLTSSTTDQWNDPAAMDQVAKVGLGDIDISEDGKFLFVTNLYQRKLFRLELDNAFNPQNVIAVDSFSMPPVTVTNGLLRPFGLAWHRGKIFIGAVSTGENGGHNTIGGTTDLYAYVFEMKDPLSTATITPIPVMTFPLNYTKGFVISGSIGSDQWHPWNNNTDSIIDNSEENLPTPILSDIEFSDKGDLIMDFCDRTGHQFSGNSRRHLTGSAMIGSLDIGGDLIIAGIDCNTGLFTLENNGSFTSNGIVHNGGVANGQGIGGGEFFSHDEWFSFHHETSVGSAAVLRGRDQVLVTLMDPVGAFSNGTAKFSTVDGLNTGNMELATMTEFGKANSLGDIEVAGDASQLQLGNRVWKDDDADGIQDAGEPGINNIDVELYADFNNDQIPDGGVLGGATTAVDGNYYFDKTNVADGDPTVIGLQAGPVPGRNYLIKIANSDWSGGIGVNDLAGYSITVSNVGGPGQPDVRDNDALLLNTAPTIEAPTYKSGQNDHRYDFGFTPCPSLTGGDVFIDCEIDSSIIGPTPTPGAIYQWSPSTYLSSATVAQPVANPPVTTIYTLTVNGICSKQYTVYVDNTPPQALPGPGKILDCHQTSVQIGTPAIAGNTYHWEPSTGLSDPNIAQPTASPGVTTTYTLTVTGFNNCASSALLTVNVEKCCARLEVPNSFSPNGDHNNDRFGAIVIENVESFYLAVYNRWGQLVFESDNPSDKWDGTYKGKDCDLGTYFYMLKYTCQTWKEFKWLKGDVTLLR